MLSFIYFTFLFNFFWFSRSVLRIFLPRANKDIHYIYSGSICYDSRYMECVNSQRVKRGIIEEINR